MKLALLAGIIATSAVGSLHCVAMCGPLVGLHGGARSLRLAGMHSFGRLTTYVLLGAAAGLLGGALNLAGHLGNVQRIATLLAGAFILGWGIYLLIRARFPNYRMNVHSSNRGSTFGTALVRIRNKPPGRRAWLMGTLTGLLPCGWLWAFVVTAGGTGSAPLGAAVMAAFWLGTVPAMVGLLAFAGPLFARARARMPAITAAALIAIGIGTLAMRWHDAGRSQVVAPHCPHCHHQGAQS
jgi:sulfite exporter TauE/SafE